MNPFVATIIKQGAALALGVGALVFVAFFMIRMASLQHELTLNSITPAL